MNQQMISIPRTEETKKTSDLERKWHDTTISTADRILALAVERYGVQVIEADTLVMLLAEADKINELRDIRKSISSELGSIDSTLTEWAGKS